MTSLYCNTMSRMHVIRPTLDLDVKSLNSKSRPLWNCQLGLVGDLRSEVPVRGLWRVYEQNNETNKADGFCAQGFKV